MNEHEKLIIWKFLPGISTLPGYSFPRFLAGHSLTMDQIILQPQMQE